jgi:hypothetical protein
VSKCTWEPIKNLSNAMEKVHECHWQYTNKPKSTPFGTCC